MHHSSFWGLPTVFFPAWPVSILTVLPWIKFFFSQFSSDGFKKPKPGSGTNLAFIDCSIWDPALFRTPILTGPVLAFSTDLIFSLTGAPMCLPKSKVAFFGFVEVIGKDSLFALFFFVYVNDFMRLYLLSAALFMLTTWSSGPQRVFIRLEGWSENQCLPPKTSKCEAPFFSLDSHQANLLAIFFYSLPSI